MPLEFSVKAYGVERISSRFRGTAKKAMNTRPAMQQVLRRLVEIERAIFDSQGNRGGGSWKALSPGWQKRKAQMGKDPRKLRMDGRLYRSLTSLQSSNMVRDIRNGELDFGSRLPYAARHQFGDSHIPARPYLKFTKRDVEEITLIIMAYLEESFGKAPTRL